MRESWTDERLDHLKERMDERFDWVDERFEQVDKRFEQVDKRFEQIESRMTEGFTRLDADIRELRHAMVVGLGIMVTGFLSLAGLIVL